VLTLERAFGRDRLDFRPLVTDPLELTIPRRMRAALAGDKL
jgi:hypothetical protein